MLSVDIFTTNIKISRKRKWGLALLTKLAKINIFRASKKLVRDFLSRFFLDLNQQSNCLS